LSSTNAVSARLKGPACIVCSPTAYKPGRFKINRAFGRVRRAALERIVEVVVRLALLALAAQRISNGGEVQDETDRENTPECLHLSIICLAPKKKKNKNSKLKFFVI